MSTTLLFKEHIEDGIASSALYSACETYRYALTRTWDSAAPKLLYIMLNPSTATELSNDPTIERCERRAKMLGYGAFRACNLFAFRATDPANLKKARNPIGPDNLVQLLEAAQWADAIICAWGTHGAYMGMGPAIANLLRAHGHNLLQLGLSKDGHPKHPLYVSYQILALDWDFAVS